MTLYQDAELTTAIQVNDVILVPNFIYVAIQLDNEYSSTLFYVQVIAQQNQLSKLEVRLPAVANLLFCVNNFSNKSLNQVWRAKTPPT